MTRNSLLLLSFFFYQHTIGLCQTNVGGTLTQNTVWNSAGSPYTLNSAIGVLSGVTLTIQPGVQVIGNFDIVIRGGTLLMSGTEGQRIKIQGSRILFRSSDLSKSSIAYVDFDHAGVQLGDENEFNQDNAKNSNTLLTKNTTFSNNSFGRTKGYQTTAKLRFELSSINNSTITGYYPRSEPIELDEVNINNSTITSESYNYGIKVTNSVVNNTSFLIGCCSANIDFFNSEINNSSFREGSGTPVDGLIRLEKINFTDTYFSLPSAKFLMTECTAKVSSSIPVFINMGNGEIKNSSIEGNSSTTLFKVTGRSGYIVGGSVVFQGMNFNIFGTAIEVLNFNQLTISQNNFLSASNYNLKNSSSKNISAIGNYWGTTNEQTIKDKIYDIYDDINSGLVNYGEFLQSKVPNALPIITWANPADIEYGTTLGVAQLNATSSIDGSFLYAPASGTKLNVGNNQRLSVTFTPTDAVAYRSVTKKVIVNVNKGTPVIVWPNPSDIVYGTLLGTTQLNATSSVEGTFSYAPAIGTKLNVGGNQSLSVLFTPTDLANYKSSTKQVSINVIKAPQTITFTALSNKTFGDAPFALSATSSSGLPLTYSSNTSVATISGNTVTIVGSGTTAITASQPGNNNYNPAPDVVQSLTVNKASQTITFTPFPNKTFGDEPFTLAGSSSSGLALTYTSSNTTVATVSGTTVTIVGAGSTTITAKQPGNNNYNPATEIGQLLTVNKASQTITFTSLPNKTFSDAPFALSGTSSSGLALTYASSNPAVATISGNTVTIVGVGTANVTAKQAGNNNYNPAADVVQSLTVNKASQTITFPTLTSKTFGDVPFDLSGTSSSGLALTYTSSNTAIATVSGNTVTIVGVGTANITAKQVGNSNYNPAADVVQSLTINKATQTITFAVLSSKTYGDTPFTVSATSSSGLPLTYASNNAGVATVSGNMVTIIGAGTATITASQAGNNNYNPASSSQSLTVNKASQSVTFTALSSKTYGDAPFTVSATSSSGLPLTYTSSNTSIATVSGNTVTIVGAGTASITASQAGNNNYNPASSPQSLAVNKASQSITFTALASKSYGAAPFTLSATSSSGLPLTYTSGNTSIATVSGNMVTIVGAGTVAITASQAGNTNYNPASDMVQPLTVTKASQTISFSNSANKTYGDAPFTLSGTSSAGLPLTYASGNTGVATVSGNMVTIVGVGTATITASQPGNNNYSPAADVAQSFTVNKANQTISFAPLPPVAVNSPAFALTATASSSLPIAYSTTSNNITLTNGSVGIVGAGRTTITATQPGNANYNAADPVSQSFCVNPAKPSIAISNLNTPNPTLTSSATEGNQWYLDGVAIAGATSTTYNATKTGSYQVQVTVDGCTGEFSDGQPVLITGIETGLPLVEVYPNPVTNGVLSISFGGMGGKKQVAVFALTGESLLSSSTESGSIEMDVANLSAGLYMARIVANGVVQTKKFNK